MAITGIGSIYENRIYENTYASKKKETAEKEELKDAASVQEANVKDNYSYFQKNLTVWQTKTRQYPTSIVKKFHPRIILIVATI